MLFLVLSVFASLSQQLSLSSVTDITPGGRQLPAYGECVPARESYRTDRSSVLRLRVPLVNKPKIRFADESTANPDSVLSK